MLRASKNPHTDLVDKLGVLVGQGILTPFYENNNRILALTPSGRVQGYQIFTTRLRDRGCRRSRPGRRSAGRCQPTS